LLLIQIITAIKLTTVFTAQLYASAVCAVVVYLTQLEFNEKG